MFVCEREREIIIERKSGQVKERDRDMFKYKGRIEDEEKEREHTDS